MKSLSPWPLTARAGLPRLDKPGRASALAVATLAAAAMAPAWAQAPAPDACAKVSMATAPAKPVPIRYGTTGSGEEPLALMWADKAAFPNNGRLYALEPTEFAATDRVTAFQAGQLDAGTISFPALVAAVHAGIDARAVATLVQVNKEDNEGAFVALADGPVRSVTDLKGKRVGYYGPNTISEYWVRSAMARAGLNPREVSFVALPPPAQEQALRNRQIDVAWLARQFLARAKTGGGLNVLMTPFDAVGTNQPSLLVMFSARFVQANPQAYCAWRADYQKALQTWVASRQALYPKLVEARYLTPFAANAGPDGGRSPGGTLSAAEFDATLKDMVSSRFLPPAMARTAKDLILHGYALER